MRVFKDADFPFLAARRKAYVVSGILLLVGLVSLFAHRGLNYGVDFTGGTVMQVAFMEPTSVSDLRAALNEEGFSGAGLQGFGAENEYLIRLPVIEDATGQDVVTELQNALDAQFGSEGFRIERTEAVGPAVGAELQTKALYAILLSFLLTLIYLAFRFEWRFGFAALIATFHDILLTLGLVSLLNIEVDLAVVAAILTIIGYSLNDTIVTFDRMRENLKKKTRRRDYVATLNRSVNDVLPRTILTSGTTLAALVALFVFGGAVIRPFALVLILGVLIGTYSSIFVASPALVEIHRRARERERTKARAA